MITKSGFYKLSSFEEKNIEIEKDLIVCLFDDTDKSFDVNIWDNSTLEYFSFLEKSCELSKKFICQNNSTVKLNNIIYSSENKIDAEILWETFWNGNNLDIKILSFAWNNGKINTHWILKINSETSKNKWILEEENIFLWESWEISWIPTLLVETNDVEASHSCKMEKISDEKLFYLRSRWIWKENALSLIIEAKIKHLYSCLEMYDKNFYDEIIKYIIEKIK